MENYKSYKMKIIVPLTLLSLFTLGSCTNYKNICVKIEHIGIQDKPILPLIISNVPLSDIEPHTVYCVVNKKTMLILNRALTEFPSSDECKRGIYTGFGSFMIKEYTDMELSKCFILRNKTESIEFFNKLIKVLVENKCEQEIINRFNYLVGRLKD